MLEGLFLLVLIVTWIFWLLAWWMVRYLLRSQPMIRASYSPPVSVLKPVRGLDAQAYVNFASFCQQEYSHFELLFGVSDSKDPAIPLIQRLQKEHPGCDIRLVVGPAFGSNRKASLLHHLANQARHEVLVISDSDMRVTPDYLSRVVAPLVDERIGLVTCPYRGTDPVNLPAQLEALYMGFTFLPSVVIASRLLSLPFAMGSTAVLRRTHLASMGGFTAIADHLADDYQLGARIAQLGLRVHLSSYVVTTILGAPTLRELWHREVRWARGNRVSRPLAYPGLVLTFSTPLALILLLVSGLAPIGWLALASSVSLRWLLAWFMSDYLGDQTARRWLVWLPVRDIMSALVWCAGGVGRHIVWRGDRYLLQDDGRMTPLPASTGNWLTHLRAWRP